MMTGLLFILFFAVAFQTKNRSVNIGAFFVWTTIISDLLFGDMPGMNYFITMALVDLFIVVILASLHNPTALCMRLIYISICFIIVQAAGAGMYHMYHPSEPYEIACFVLYILTIISLLIPDKLKSEGNIDDGYNSVWTRIYRGFSPRCIPRNKGKA